MDVDAHNRTRAGGVDEWQRRLLMGVEVRAGAVVVDALYDEKTGLTFM
ncbi:MAG: hypothetical protein ACRDZO_01615 [Egibacteraceae bacterium]